MRTRLLDYAVQDIELPLLVVRICSCQEATVIESEPEYLKNLIRIVDCKWTRKGQRLQRDCAPEIVQASRGGGVRTAVVETEIVRSNW